MPIPVFYCKKCGEALATAETFKQVEDLALSADDGIDGWFETKNGGFGPENAECSQCGHEEFEKETDILDVWFESGASSRAVCEPHPDLTWPADLYLEGSDQHRGWFQSSLLPAIAVKGAPPYKSVITHGYVVDGDGKKLSKKLGNFVELPTLLDKVGADVVRLWVASENYRQDIRLSDEILSRTQDAYRRIRNTFRFGLSNLGDFSADDAVAYDELEEIDRWALHKTQELRTGVLKAYDTYEYHQAFHSFLNFCTVELSSFYFDVLKDRLYTFDANSRERRAGQTVIAEILVDLLKLFAPILAHTCDEVWQHLPGHLRTAECVHLTQFPEDKPNHSLVGETLDRWNELLRLRGVVSKHLEDARRDKIIGSSLEAALRLTPGNEHVAKVLSAYADRLPSVFIVSACKVEEPSDEAAQSESKILVTVEKASGKKCVRCWNYRDSVGTVAQHPEICDRCAEQLGVSVA